MCFLAHVFKIFLGLLALTAAQAQAMSWTVEVYDGVKYPTFSYAPVYADYDCNSQEIYMSLPADFNIIFNNEINIRFGTETIAFKVLDSTTSKSEEGQEIQDLVIDGKDMTRYMVDANYYLLLPDNRAGVGIPLKGFQDAMTAACAN
jgi:hypothetical protein